jgi:hypothetical protein
MSVSGVCGCEREGEHGAVHGGYSYDLVGVCSRRILRVVKKTKK